MENETIVPRDTSVYKPNQEVREQILNFQSLLQNVDDKKYIVVDDKQSTKVCPLKHTFSDGIYVREIFIPAGMFIVGKIHKHDHPNFLLSGEVTVVTEDGIEDLKGPLSIMSKAGTKRALYAITDLVWITVHANPTNTEDLKELEEEIIAPTYLDYEKFKQLKQ
tara:strand:- start:1197 stop:1688 length:492 start_codon:yes stop_codon:yes gene_type:complete